MVITTIDQSVESHKEQIQLFIEEVLHWPCYERWRDYVEKYLHHRQLVTAYPVCYWDSERGYWVVDPDPDQVSREFNPYESLDYAWEILEAVPTPGWYSLVETLREENNLWVEYSRVGLATTICDLVWKICHE